MKEPTKKFLVTGLVVVVLLGLLVSAAMFNNAYEERSAARRDSLRLEEQRQPTKVQAPPKPKPDYGHIWDAYEICKDAVKERLKAPSTADFVGRASEVVEDHGQGRYIVQGSVDAENSFGANLRNEYTCGLEYSGSGRYKLLAVTIE